MDDLGAHRAYLGGAHLFQEDRSPGPQIPARLLHVEEIAERERGRERERGLNGPRHTSAFSPLELQIYVPHGTRPGR